MSDEKVTREAIAVHEAGHAVVAWALGLIVGRLWIDDNGRSGGMSPVDAGQLSIIDQIAIWMAGQQATDILRIEAPTFIAGKDREEVIKLTSRLPDKAQEQLRAAGQKRAIDILRQHDRMLKDVADALDKAGRIDKATFAEITAGSG